jgi:hypothetical protein
MSFEQSRWRDSPFSPYATGGDDDESEGDDE